MSDTDDTSKMVAGALLAVIVPALMVGSSIWHGYALSVLWGWFAEPILHVRLGLGPAVGVMLIKAVLLPSRLNKEGEKSDGGALWTYLILAPALWLGMGYIAHQWLAQ